MVAMLGLSEADAQRWRQQFAASLASGQILAVSRSAAEMVGEFARLGIDATGCEWREASGQFMWVDRDGNTLPAQPPKTWQQVIVAQDVLEECMQYSGAAFQDRFGAPQRVLVILSSAASGPLLPAAAKWLWQAGYAHDLSADTWTDGAALTCVFRPKAGGIEQMVEAYEAELYRLAQLSQKRRALFPEYLNEYVASVFHYERKTQGLGEQISSLEQKSWSFEHINQDLLRDKQLLQQENVSLHQENASLQQENASLRQKVWSLEHAVEDWQNRWEAFWNSRTGKMLKMLRRGPAA